MVTLQKAKRHIRVDFDEDDDYINDLIIAAEDFVRDKLNRPVRPSEMTNDNKWEVPATVDLAELLLIGHWYENRSAVVVGSISTEVDLTVKDLIGKYKLVSFGV